MGLRPQFVGHQTAPPALQTGFLPGLLEDFDAALSAPGWVATLPIPV